MKHITIHLTGAAAAVTGCRDIELELHDSATYQDTIIGLGATLPALIGLVIGADGKTMLSSNMFVVNGKDIVMHGMWGLQPAPGDVLTLISPATGGA